MKKPKTNNRSLISKITARVMLIILLFTSTVSFSACGKGVDKYVKMNYLGDHVPMQMIISSNSKIFPKDDVTLNLSYGFQIILYNGELDNRNEYFIEEYELTYGIYIADNYDYKNANNCSWYTTDIEDIDGYQFIKQISEEEALSEEYWVVFPYFAYGYGSEEYKHTERITIPKEYVNNPTGDFAIIITMFGATDGGTYIALRSMRVECYYTELDENTIEIDMEDWDYFRIKKPLFE